MSISKEEELDLQLKYELEEVIQASRGQIELEVNQSKLELQQKIIELNADKKKIHQLFEELEKHTNNIDSPNAAQSPFFNMKENQEAPIAQSYDENPNQFSL